MAGRKPRSSVDSGDMQIGQDSPLELPEVGNSINRNIDVVDGPDAMDKAEMLAFMEEPVKIMVHTSADPNAEAVIQTGVNGRTQFFIRGMDQVVRRKYVECLARAKHTGFTQKTVNDLQTGNVTQKMIPHTALKYPFSVVQDDNRRGRDWLKQILAEA